MRLVGVFVEMGRCSTILEPLHRFGEGLQLLLLLHE